LLSLSNISVSYGDLTVLWDVSIKVDKGEIVALVGSNGAGKTTTLKTICGLILPNSGQIEFLGEKINGLPPFRIVEKGIAYVPEGRHVFPYMTVLENLEMGAYTRRAREKIKETLEWVHQLFPVLKERQSQLAGTLSGGEQQMLAIARGLMSRPQLLMLDEPSLGLAPMFVVKVFDMIKKINLEGVSVLLVEQNVRYALHNAHRGYVLETGKIVLTGEGKELLESEHVRKAYLGV
jgi:branched-chain amino acid transport system ATP-binding protein